ncbi:MAG: gliding motility lipoprotein GldD [Bacteroidia bacterium]|nr:gliding motility lipoprotein GldD [Bacteroidia bacterium]NNK61401.1 gliding motility lipoprotein GldD [Flavobacteriaceae bacterium]
MRNFVLAIICLSIFSCDDPPLPKPKAYLRLEYPQPKYKILNTELPFVFEKNILADSVGAIKVSRDGKSKGIDLVYPNLKGTIYVTYKAIDKSNLELFLMDAQNITQTHTVKADEIIEQPYINTDRKVYGMFYEVGGNAASQSQFYVTDSVRHFVTGSLYFYAKPNYDSILPAAHYLKNDIQHIMETITWKK